MPAAGVALVLLLLRNLPPARRRPCTTATQRLMQPLPCLPQAVCLDPRYAARKTHELVYGTAAGALTLSSKVRGWLPPLCPLPSLLYCCSASYFPCI
jgi:hypothetical protein